MAYQKYTTDTLVLGSFERGEADKTLVLYTRDFGLVYARAVGIRKESSRMRYALQDCSRAFVSLVRGKRGWRVAGATAVCVSSGAGKKGTTSFTRVVRLLRRLIQGEEKNEYLFDTLAEAHAYLLKGREDLHATVELMCVARMLYALGYLSSEAMGAALFKEASYSAEQLQEAARVEKILLRSVNEAIAGSQL